MVKKIFLKASIFIIILSLIIITLNSIFIIKTNHRAKLTQGLYTDTETPLDVVLLGSSHMNALIDPNVLWNKYGITSFNYATGGQPIDVSYYLLKEVLKTHKNPIVVVDLYYLGSPDKYGTEGYIRYVLDNLKFSANKVQAIMNCTPLKQWANYFFPVFKYHDRWKELTEIDFNFDTTETYFQKGFVANHDLYGKEDTSNPPTTEIAAIPPKTEEYMNKIIDLSKKEGFKLIFTNSPHDYNKISKANAWVKEPAKTVNKASAISKKNNIPFINYSNMIDELGFDFKTDMANAGHLNLSGAKKVTLNFGGFLEENYKLVDHRNDAKYKKWNSDYIIYSRVEASKDITTETDIKKYISLIKNKNYTILASSNNDVFSKNSNLKEALGPLGLQFDSKNNVNSNYLAVINNNKVQSETLSGSTLSKEFVFDKDTNFKVTTKSSDKNMPSMLFNGVECLNEHNGLNIVVYDKSLKKVIDNIYLDSTNVIKR